MTDLLVFMGISTFATGDEMRKLDEMAVSSGLEVRQMMELAAYHIAEYCIEHFRGKSIGIYAGAGNNGGDAIAVARFLKNAGVGAEIVLMHDKKELKEGAKHHLLLSEKIGIPCHVFHASDDIPYDVIVDGLLGYSLSGDPKSPYCECIQAINDSSAIIVSIDIPSGFDSNVGKPLSPCVQADATLFLAYPKKGFKQKENRIYFGECFLIDVGIPDVLYTEAGLSYPF